jgi:hypothetical protein
MRANDTLRTQPPWVNDVNRKVGTERAKCASVIVTQNNVCSPGSARFTYGLRYALYLLWQEQEWWIEGLGRLF